MAQEGLVVKKQWGEEEYICNNEQYCGKFLYIAPGFACSIHRHPVKTETFHVLSGEGCIGVDQDIVRVVAGNTIHIPQQTYHFFASVTGMTLLEISSHHEDDDCQRATESHPLSWMRDTPALLKMGLTHGEKLPA
jgi:quercetin dioxygenase-like cupin family protein